MRCRKIGLGSSYVEHYPKSLKVVAELRRETVTVKFVCNSCGIFGILTIQIIIYLKRDDEAMLFDFQNDLSAEMEVHHDQQRNI